MRTENLESSYSCVLCPTCQLSCRMSVGWSYENQSSTRHSKVRPKTRSGRNDLKPTGCASSSYWHRIELVSAVRCRSRQFNRRKWTEDQHVRVSTLLIGDIDDAFRYRSPRRVHAEMPVTFSWRKCFHSASWQRTFRGSAKMRRSSSQTLTLAIQVYQ